MVEKRNSARIVTKVKSEVHSIDGMTFSTSADLSSGGIFISTPEPINIGSEVELSLYVPGKEEPFEIKGIVRWMREDENKKQKAGMGIEFIDFSLSDYGIENDLIE